MYERDVPSISPGVVNPVPTEVGANGAFCAYGKRTCFAPEVAIVSYVEDKLSVPSKPNSSRRGMSPSTFNHCDEPGQCAESGHRQRIRDPFV